MAINLIIVALLAILIVAALIYLIKNGEIKLGDDNQDSQIGTKNKKPLPVNKIFYEFRHNSYSEWLKWISTQDTNRQETAFSKLAEHLESEPKSWGYITTEVIKAIAEFNNTHKFDSLVSFLDQTRKHWGEYKAIPTYYETVSKAIISLKPNEACEIFDEELSSVSADKNTEMKKKIIINALVEVENSKTISKQITDILASPYESSNIKLHTLDALSKMNESDQTGILTKVIESFVENSSEDEELAATDIEIFEKIISKATHLIGKEDIFEVVAEACKTPKLRSLTTNTIKQILQRKNNDFKKDQLFNIHNLEDPNDDLKEALCERNGLTDKESDLCHELMPTVFTEEQLIKKNLKEFDLPIPSLLKDSFKDFSETLLKEVSFSLDTENNDKKQQGGVLLHGSAEYEKIYFARLLALSKKWGFIYIDTNELTNKEYLENVINLINSAPRPCVTFLRHIDRLCSNDEKNTQDLLNSKLTQQLHLHSIDKRFYLIGTVNQKISNIDNSQLIRFIDNFCVQFLPFSMEFTTPSQEERLQIIENFSDRLPQGLDEELTTEFLGNEKKLSKTQFYYYILQKLQVMLLTYGSIVSIEQCNILEDKFSSPTFDQGNKKKSLSEFLS